MPTDVGDEERTLGYDQNVIQHKLLKYAERDSIIDF